MMNILKVGDLAPDFTATPESGKLVQLRDFSGQWLVLYFYPKDNTPGCTTEAKDFTAYKEQFEKLRANIVGVSPDSESSHQKFSQKHTLSLDLVSDPDHKIAEAYGVWGLKKFMGKEYMGIIRSTFLINPDGKISQIWSKVRVKNHVEKVLSTLQEITKNDNSG
jgi:peroxiredoxin Q/BCP